jgi:hypothetical protein
MTSASRVLNYDKPSRVLNYDKHLTGFKRGTTRLWEIPEGPGKLPQGKVFSSFGGKFKSKFNILFLFKQCLVCRVYLCPQGVCAVAQLLVILQEHLIMDFPFSKLKRSFRII